MAADLAVEALKILQAWGWPLAVLTLAWWFRTEIKEALPRVTKAGPIDLASPQQQRVDPVDSPKNLSPLELKPATRAVAPIEESLRKETMDLPEDKRVPMLLRALAETRLLLHFERIYRIIFGSQIRALQALNERPKISKDDARVYYEQLMKELSPFYDDFSFENWSGFLINNRLVDESEGFYAITEIGRDFLHFITEYRLTPSKPG